MGCFYVFIVNDSHGFNFYVESIMYFIGYFLVLGVCYIICYTRFSVKNYINSSCICYSSSSNSIVSSCQFVAWSIYLCELLITIQNMFLYIWHYSWIIFFHTQTLTMVVQFESLSIKKSIKKMQKHKVFFLQIVLYIFKNNKSNNKTQKSWFLFSNSFWGWLPNGKY